FDPLIIQDQKIPLEAVKCRKKISTQPPLIIHSYCFERNYHVYTAVSFWGVRGRKVRGHAQQSE
ncbi:MAG TPA: hypothetical protein PK048_02085, partial [Candidatus Absconditabacterales bacterium]|nr:hypothetical protein [Candidatus Absconditabacterales bacterium]